MAGTRNNADFSQWQCSAFAQKEVQRMYVEALLALLTLVVAALFLRSRQSRKLDHQKGKRIAIVFATQTGTCRTLAHKLFSMVSARGGDVTLLDIKMCDADTLHKMADVVVFIVSTFSGGSPPPSASVFAELLKDMSNDFRVSRDHLSHVKFAVFGLGSVAYGENFNGFAKNLVDWLRGLGGKFVNVPVFAAEQRSQGLFALFAKGVCDGIEKDEVGVEDDDDDGNSTKDVDDVEEICADESRNELLYPRLRDNLSKQGYALIGSHSGVKLCRWTKSMLRGRGGCYKHTFYNISSYQCMEMTPSLACANKCVFCWRHHTNPVAKSFTWKHDAPEFLVEGALSSHRSMIKQMKGVPGVQPDRFVEAMNVKHCALSLVGEPIIYPEINRFVGILHEKHISTFMVTNAQFPDRIHQLAPVTQLYVSIDAATKDELKRIDRPIFDDFWERMLDCVKEIGLKRQRTVFRLTLVNGYNVENIAEYAQLVRMGKPDFVEVKGVTFCGASEASDLTMKHVPYHHEVVRFCEALCQELGEDVYGIACEHEHSCCMLMAKQQFKIDGVWHTWIDYAKFFELIESGRTDFTSLEYAAPTPSWAVFQSKEHGFDPAETRHKKEVVTSGC